ncbi:MAG TPA: nuclear transport factor 2 family protein [Steroidobacteraceae bacterium]|nr:nuclear transport factor 2 family protein [Steroidobacteraceae bacterium]
MNRLSVIALLVAAALPTIGAAADPVVTDSRLINEERRVQILEAKLASLQRQVLLVEDRRAIERLQQLWGHYVSEGMAREAASLFAASPVASIEYAQQGVYLGRSRIEAFLLAGGARVRPGELRETPIMQAVISVAPDGLTAKGRWRSLVMGGMQGQDGRWEEGPYENEYVKEGGNWKISRLHWFTTMNGSYDKGWHRQSFPAAGPLAELPPDRPPSVRYRSFPSFFLAPYHYLNPVTGQPVAWDYPPAEAAP